MNIVSSDFQPDHPKWPGKIKGWPIPSLAYQRDRWDLYIKHQQDFITALEELTATFDATPDTAAQEEWDHAFVSDRNSLVGYDGPRDPKYREKLKKDYARGLEQTRAELWRLQKGRP